ncbi:MAG TPA: O-antigen ligase family protein [Vicinamibacterales bacterium]
MQRALLLSLVAVSYILFAGGPRWTLIPLLVLAAATVLAAPRRTLSFPRETRSLDLALIAVIVAMVIQMTPLPGAIVGILSPNAADLRASLQFPAVSSGWARLSVNPRASEVSLSVVILGVVTFWIARGAFGFGASTRQFCRALAVIGAAAALSAVIFRVAAPGLVNGVLAPESRSANPFGAFINRNHFAGWLLMIVGPVGGYLIAHLRIHPAYRQQFRLGLKQFLVSGAMVTAMAAATVLVVMLLTLSRSAAAGLGAAAIVAWRIGRRRARLERSTRPILLAVAAMGLVAAVLFVDIAGWTTRLEESLDTTGDRNRITIWRESAPVLRDFWVTGTGTGTYSDAMVKYQQSKVWIPSMGRWAHFNNAHSHYLQVAAEGGLLLLAPVLTALALLVKFGRRALRQDRGEMQWARIGAAAGLVGIAVQSVWETSLVMPANAILCGAVAGLLLYQRPQTLTRSPEPLAYTPDVPMTGR